MELDLTNKEEMDKKSIDFLESLAGSCRKTANEYSKKFILILAYIKTNYRWRENTKFKNSSFETYVESLFMLKPNQYRELEKAYILYPEESQKYGTGMIAKIIRQVPAYDVPKVMDEIRKKEKNRKDKAVTAEHIHEVTGKYKKKYINTTKIKLNKYDELVSENEKLREENKFLRMELKEKEEQIEKLKKSVEKYKKLSTSQSKR